MKYGKLFLAVIGGITTLSAHANSIEKLHGEVTLLVQSMAMAIRIEGQPAEKIFNSMSEIEAKPCGAFMSDDGVNRCLEKKGIHLYCRNEYATEGELHRDYMCAIGIAEPAKGLIVK